MDISNISIPAIDGYLLSADIYSPVTDKMGSGIIINSATAVPKRFYEKLAVFLAEQGHCVITYDYRGVGGSSPGSLRGFKAQVRDWVLLDMAGVVDWVDETCSPKRLIMLGHSLGGQLPGMLPNAHKIDSMVTISSQNGYWLNMGGFQKVSVAFHMHLTLPLLSHLCGYMPWSKLGSSEDIPKGAAIEFARWCRLPGYLFDDATLPLNRYKTFEAPVLAYSFADDPWGTEKSVSLMMGSYPNVRRKHVSPEEEGLHSIGHFGFFRPSSISLWKGMIDWLTNETAENDKRQVSP